MPFSKTPRGESALYPSMFEASYLMKHKVTIKSNLI
uniref:Uncharacterized protein n=1 Tax=Rhizophora mucronata TaxID=61149 RepID=A0A2P2MQ17_RHIMU